jgi:hypothetical protein
MRHSFERKDTTIDFIFKDLEAMCPYRIVNPFLCAAALSSLMVDKSYCYSESYEGCPIFLLNKAETHESCEVHT